MISSALERYWGICLLKESPENTPYSIILGFISGVSFILCMVFEWNFTYFASGNDLGSTIVIATSLILSYVFYTYIVLSIKGFKSRLVQTITALFCTNIIIHILVFPLLFISPYLIQLPLNPMLLFLRILYLLISIGLSIWQFLIIAHIYKYALSTTLVHSVLVAFGLIAMNILTVSSLH